MSDLKIANPSKLVIPDGKTTAMLDPDKIPDRDYHADKDWWSKSKLWEAHKSLSNFPRDLHRRDAGHFVDGRRDQRQHTAGAVAGAT